MKERTDSGELVSSVHENVDMRKKSKIRYEGKSISQGIEHRSYKSDSTDVDKLSFIKRRDTKAEGAINKKDHNTMKIKFLQLKELLVEVRKMIKILIVTCQRKVKMNVPQVYQV